MNRKSAWATVPLPLAWAGGSATGGCRNDAQWAECGAGLATKKLIDGKKMTLNLKAGPAWRQTELVTGGHEVS